MKLLLQKYFCQRKCGIQGLRSILAYKNCHTQKSSTNETSEERSESFSDNSFSDYRNASPHVRSFSGLNRSYGYSKRNVYGHQQQYFKKDFRFKPVYHNQYSYKERTPVLTEKFFYVEHPDIVNRSEGEVEEFRRRLNMSILGINVPKPITKFSELCLPEKLMQVLSEENYEKPSPIQSQGWPIALTGRDMIGVSQTGSGKTLAYMLPAIVHALNQEKIDMNKCNPRILVLGPTRELIQQIFEVSKKFLHACGLIGSTVYGGASKAIQLSYLKGAEVCIATPGRLLDYLSYNQVTLENCTFLVLDEADRMLDMGFEPQIRDIIDQIRPERQTLMWSATWPREVRSLAEEFLTDYIHVTIGSGDLVANPNIKQNIYVTSEHMKEKELCSLLKSIFREESKVLVFAQTKRKVDQLTDLLNDEGFEALGIHGDISQFRRDSTLKRFRRNKSCILIATDIAARGLDITDIQHVINYDFPLNIEDYIHRIGRTARGLNLGESHSFITSENAGLVKGLISVLEQSNQSINPELYSLDESRGKPSKFNNRSYNRQRMYRQRLY